MEELAGLTGQKLAGNNGLLSGEDGLDRTTSWQAENGSGHTPRAVTPVHATRLAGVDAKPLPAMPPSPFM